MQRFERFMVLSRLGARRPPKTLLEILRCAYGYAGSLRLVQEAPKEETGFPREAGEETRHSRYDAAAAEGWQSGRMRRSRKPLSVVRRIESSNLSPSACRAGIPRGWRDSGVRRMLPV